ncbi:NACHT, LRR and PYD domains-containing protein 1b allele 2-like [Dromaius novaehollandiae]|uniref:NACHT, LRR and PYD domains-containing protein 1b allele 2-like n=1 Tax=Dromaius novaehollandiae TaxID=8790 RepID=UPI00311ED555
MSYRVDKPPLTKRLNCGRSYIVSGSAPAAVHPKILDFHLRGAEKQQIFSEIYLSVMVEEVKLSLKDKRKDKCMWHAVLRRGDIAPSRAGADAPRASLWLPGLWRSRPGWADRGQIPGAFATTTEMVIASSTVQARALNGWRASIQAKVSPGACRNTCSGEVGSSGNPGPVSSVCSHHIP